MAVPKVKLTDISVGIVRAGYRSMYPSQRAKFLACLNEAERAEVLAPASFTSDYNVSFEIVNIQSVVSLFTYVYPTRKQEVLDALNEEDRLLVCTELKAWHQRIFEDNEHIPAACGCVACRWMEEMMFDEN